MQPDGDQGAEFEGFAREGEGVGGCVGGGDERVEVQEGELGGGEEGRGAGVVVAREGFVELVEEGGEVFFGHVVVGGSVSYGCCLIYWMRCVWVCRLEKNWASWIS